MWRSLDAGQSWAVVLSNPDFSNVAPTTNGCFVGCTDLQIRPDSDPDQLWAAFGNYDNDGPTKGTAVYITSGDDIG